jgi:hypothetical protein
MDSAENNQEVNTIPERAGQDSAENAANKILNMWESEDQPTDEETETTVDEEVVEEEESVEDETEEVSEEEQAEEEVVEDEETEEVDEEETEEEVPDTYRVKVDGEEYDVNLDELKSGYQRQADYTRKSQVLAEQRKHNEAIYNERARLDQERQMYANGLQMLQDQQEAKFNDFDNIDWNTLKEEDPYQYMIKKDEYRDAQERVTNIAQQQQIIQEEQSQSLRQVRANFVQQEYAKLVQALPEWKDAKSTIKQDIQKYAASVGFQPEEINQLADHRSVLIIKKAMEFDKIADKIAPKKKKVKKVPKVQKSGRGKVKSEAANEAAKKKRTRLRKSGHQDDAASIFYDML